MDWRGQRDLLSFGIRHPILGFSGPASYIPIGSTKMEKESTEKKNAPVAKFTAGLITVSVWENKAVNSRTGDQFLTHSVTLDRRYLDTDGTTWKSTNSYAPNDLPKLGLALSQAYAFCVQKTKDKE
jgi:hypothetical protein